MKKLTLTYLLIIISSIWTQSVAQKGLNIGVNFNRITDKMFGSTFENSKISNEPNFATNFSNGFSYGLTFRYGFNETIGVSTGIKRGYRNVKTTINNNPLIFNLSETIDLLQIPFKLTLRARINQRRNITWNSFIGGSLSFLNPINYEGGGYSSNDPINTYTYDYTVIQQDKIIKSIIFGTGIEKGFKEYGNIYIGFSFHYNLANDVRHYSSYDIGAQNYQLENYFNFSYLSFDFIYYLPWNAFTGKKRIAYQKCYR